MHSVIEKRNKVEILDYNKFPKFEDYAVIWTSHAKKRSLERTSSFHIANVFLWDMLESIPTEFISENDGYVWLRDKDTNYTYCININNNMKKIRVVTVGLTFCYNSNKMLYPYQNESVIERRNGELSHYVWDRKERIIC